MPVAEGRKLAAAISGAKYIEYEEFPHGIFFAANCEQVISDIEEFVTGKRPEAAEEADRVLATVLFTDIVDLATLHWAHPDGEPNRAE